jgi:hypothetical protein
VAAPHGALDMDCANGRGKNGDGGPDRARCQLGGNTVPASGAALTNTLGIGPNGEVMRNAS